MIWLKATRPKTLFISISPVLIGTVSARHIDWFLFLMTLLCAFSIQIGTNFANDYFGHRLGEDTKQRKGPLRYVAAGLISPKQMMIAMIAAFICAAAFAIYLTTQGGWIILLLFALSVAAGIGYSAGRYSLARLGAGDLCVFLFFGPIATITTYYLQTKSLIWLAAIAPGLLPVAVLVANNLRDYEEDKRTGKRTLVVRFGKTFGKWEYYACLFAGVLSAILFRQASLLLCLGALIPACRKPGLIPAIQTLIFYTLFFCIGSL